MLVVPHESKLSARGSFALLCRVDTNEAPFKTASKAHFPNNAMNTVHDHRHCALSMNGSLCCFERATIYDIFCMITGEAYRQSASRSIRHQNGLSICTFL